MMPKGESVLLGSHGVLHGSGAQACYFCDICRLLVSHLSLFSFQLSRGVRHANFLNSCKRLCLRFIYLALLVLPLQVCASIITLLLAWFTLILTLMHFCSSKQNSMSAYGRGEPVYILWTFCLIYCHHTPKRGRLKGHVCPNSLLEYNDNISMS